MNTPARHRTFRAAPLAALALAFCLAAQARAQDFAALETIYLNDHLKAHDLDTFAGALIRDVINPRPASAEAWLALQRLMDIRRDLGDQAPLYAMLQRHADADFAACGVHADSFADAYLELARDHAPDALWHAVARRRAGLTAAAWIGPFAEAGAPAHDDVFAPEAAHDMAGSAAGAYGRVGWRKLGPVHDLDGEIDLGAESRWMGCGYYLAFDLICGGGRTVVLKPRFNGPGKLWLNGELIANMDTRARDYARPWLTVELRRGRNLLVVKLASASPLTLRLRTPDGAVPEGVVCEAPPASTVLKLNASASRPVEPVPPELALLGLGCGATARQNAALALALAAGYAAHGLRDQAMEHAQQALDTAPEEPLVRLAWLSMLSESPLHSGSERRRLESAGIAELLRQNEGLAPAWLARAALMTRDERWQEADEALSRVASLAPAWRVQLARAEVFGRAGWRAEQLGALRAAVKAAPRALPPRLALARYWNLRGHTGAQIAAERDVLALVPAHRDALASLVTALLRTGQPDEALKSAWLQAALDPYSPYAQGRLATALLACGRLDDACAVFELLASRTGRPEQYWQDAARACLQHGDATRAAGFLGRALDASPGEHGARRQLGRLTGESEDFWSPWALPLEEAMRHDVKPEDFPRADSALVLDEMVQLVYSDGSSRSYVHQVRKVLTQDGVDQRGRERVNGEIVLARTLGPDGSVLEPITYSGNQLEFPGVRVGCYIELAWLNHGDANPWNTLMGDRFYFADQHHAEPFAVSRWVLVAPRATRLEIRSQNLQPGDYANTTRDGMAVHVWDVRRPTHPQDESFAPSPLETIPWVEITLPRDMSGKARETAERGLNAGRRLTALVRDKAAELCAGAATDEQKARRIYEWVNDKLTTRGDGFHPHQSLKALAGDRQELFIALCTAAGVKLGFACADYAPEYKPAVEEDLPALNYAYLRRDDFPLFLVVVPGDDGKPVYLDLGDRLRPFGFLSARRSRAPVLVWRQGRVTLEQLPATAPDTDRFENRATLRLDAKGDAAIEGSISIFGDRAWGLKEALRTQPADEMQSRLERELAGLYGGLDLDSFSAPGLDLPGTPLVRRFAGTVRSLADVGADRMTLELPMENLGQLLSALCSTAERRSAIVLNFDLHQRDEIRVVAPAGWRFGALPQGLVYPTAPLLYALSFELENDELVIRRTLALGPGRIEPALYGPLTRQVKQIGQSEQARIELVRRP